MIYGIHGGDRPQEFGFNYQLRCCCEITQKQIAETENDEAGIISHSPEWLGDGLYCVLASKQNRPLLLFFRGGNTAVGARVRVSLS